MCTACGPGLRFFAVRKTSTTLRSSDEGRSTSRREPTGLPSEQLRIVAFARVTWSRSPKAGPGRTSAAATERIGTAVLIILIALSFPTVRSVAFIYILVRDRPCHDDVIRAVR